jgi:hypothetical protein
VLEAMDRGLTRSEAMHTVAGEEQLRAGHVAAAYWRVERERQRQAAAARRPVQLELGEEGA